ncbi:hypothetical protein AB833_16325 [Chromatiales bacterium (ex Bugula neritina AB1)]|nr:hypothetical protein AB833_16325 [Chromatiales bacterium (ex Bugula neritina AB1)]
MASRSPHTVLVKRILLMQLFVALLVPAVLLPFGTNAALSASAGCIASLVPNLYFAFRAFRYSGARSAQKILRSFYAGEAVKLVLTALIFALCFKYLKTLNVAALFGGFIMVQMAIWLTPLLADR